jgi:hypothetical protein
MTSAEREKWRQRIAEDLRAVQAAKRDLIVNGKTVSIQGSHSYTKADLPELLKMEADLVNEIRAFNRSGSGRRSEIPTYD